MVTEPQILSSFSPRACPRGMLTCFLSLPPMLAHLLFCRGPGIYTPLTFLACPTSLSPGAAHLTRNRGTKLP